MLEAIKGRVAEEQQEVDGNLGKAYLNIAAVHLQQHFYGEATIWCTKALKLDGSNDKALLRRARAHMGRHNYEVTLGDVGGCTCVQASARINMYLRRSFDLDVENPTSMCLSFIACCLWALPDFASQTWCILTGVQASYLASLRVFTGQSCDLA